MKNRAFWVTLGLCLLAAVLRIVRLNMDIWGDESVSWAYAFQSSIGQTVWVSRSDGSPPLYYIALHIAIRLFGDAPFALRYASYLAGIMLIPLSYRLVRVFGFSGKNGVMAAALAAFSSLLIYYSQEARAYAFLAVLGLSSALALAQLIQKSRLQNAFIYIFLAAMVYLTHGYGVLLLAAQGVCLLLFCRNRAGVLAIASLCVMGMAGAISAFSHLAPRTDINLSASSEAATSFLNALGGGVLGMQNEVVLPFPKNLAFPNSWLNWALPIFGLAFLWMAAAPGIRRLRGSQLRGVIVCAACAILPVIFAWLANSPVVGLQKWLLRGLIFVFPAFFVLFGMMLRPGRKGAAIQYVGVVGAIVVNVLGLVPYYTTYQRFPEGPALHKLASIVQKEDWLVADPYYWNMMLRYYIRDHDRMVGFDSEYGFGWVDVNAMSRDDYLGALRPLARLPSPPGRLFVYARKQNLQWSNNLENMPIFVYDLASQEWQPLR